MCSDLRYVLDVPAPMWQWLSDVASGCSVGENDVRRESVWSSLATLAYSFRDSFEQLRRLPLSLTQGNLRANVECLSHVEFCTLKDEFSQTMRMCIELGVDFSVLEDVLNLAREAPCCTNLVEQGHGSAAATLKSHSQLGSRSVQIRAALHQSRALFSELPTHRILKRVGDAITEIMRQLGGRRRQARSAFFQFLLRDARGERPSDMDPVAWARRCVQEHATKFTELPWASTMELHVEAKLMDVHRQRRWLVALRELEERRSRLLRQLEDDLDDVAAKPNLVSSHRLDADDLGRCAEVVASLRSTMTLTEMRGELLQSPVALGQSDLGVLAQLSTFVDAPSEKPEWLRMVALNREQFYGAVVYQTLDEEGHIPARGYMPLVALQRPYAVVWLLLDLVPMLWSTDLAAHRGDGHDREHRSPTFSFENLEFTSDPGIFSACGGELWVLEDVDVVSGSLVCAPCSPVRFHAFTRYFEARGTQVAPTRRAWRRSPA